MVGQADPFQPGAGLPAGVVLGDTPGPQAEGDVLERGEVREEQVVLEDDGYRPPFRGDEDVGRRVVEALAVEVDAARVDGQEAGEATERRALAGAVRSQEGDDLARLGVELDVELEGTEGPHDAGVKCHAWGGPPPRNRSRRATRTPKDTAMRTKLKMMASSGLVSLAR